MRLQCNVLDDALNIDVRIFVADMIKPARASLGMAEPTGRYKLNYERTMQRHPNGLVPVHRRAAGDRVARRAAN